jgi:chromate reductase, NAD(P)H dehydrogenase (quinone)
MPGKYRIIAICGSTRNDSINLSLIGAIKSLFGKEIDFDVFAGLSLLPHFNPDLDNENPPQEVDSFRKRIRIADGVLISTPEYALGTPGSLKNAIDWTVSSMEFSHKPVALITAASQGEKSHASLLDTLTIIESNITAESQLVISFAKTKIKGASITDLKTLEAIKQVMNALLRSIRNNAVGTNS